MPENVRLPVKVLGLQAILTWSDVVQGNDECSTDSEYGQDHKSQHEVCNGNNDDSLGGCKEVSRGVNNGNGNLEVFPLAAKDEVEDHEEQSKGSSYDVGYCNLVTGSIRISRCHESSTNSGKHEQLNYEHSKLGEGISVVGHGIDVGHVVDEGKNQAHGDGFFAKFDVFIVLTGSTRFHHGGS